MRLRVTHRQPHKRAARQRVGMRRAFAREIGQIEQPFAAGRDRGGGGQQVVIGDARGQRVAIPAQTARRGEHHAHQMPAVRHGMTKRVQTALRVIKRRVDRGKNDAGSAQRQRNDAFADRAHADRARALVAAAGDDRRARDQPGRLGRHGRNRPRHLGAFIGGRDKARRNPQLFEQCGRPIAGAQVKEDGPRRTGAVGGKFTGEPIAQIIFGQEELGGAGKDFRLLLADPENLGRGKARQCVVAGDADKFGLAHARANLVALRPGALVVPQDGRAQHRTRRIEQHQAVHLPG